jgi:uncharacterized membrane protein YfcA
MLFCFAYLVLTADHENLEKHCSSSNSTRVCSEYLACTSDKCNYCSEDSDCHLHFFCHESETYDGNKICEFEPFIHKWGVRLALSMVVVFITGILVSGAGIGGGGLFVPIMILLLEFPTNHAIPSSKAMIFGGSVAGTLFNIRKKHHFYSRPLINYNVAAIIEPTSWLGTIVGVIFNEILPSWLLYGVQFFLLSFTAWRTFKKAFESTRKDEKSSESSESQYDGPAYSKLLFLVLFVSYLLFLFLTFARGGRRTKSIVGADFCSAWYWVLTFGPFPVYVGLTFIVIHIAKDYPVLGKNATTTFKGFLVLMGSGFAAGIAAGFLGIGGGMIKGPILLALGIEAEEMGATATFMNLLTSSITSIQFMVLGTMEPSHFGILASFGFVSFLIGVAFLRWLVNKFNSRSIFLFVLAAIILISSILIVIVGVIEIVRNVRNDIPMGFINYCR